MATEEVWHPNWCVGRISAEQLALCRRCAFDRQNPAASRKNVRRLAAYRTEIRAQLTPRQDKDLNKYHTEEWKNTDWIDSHWRHEY